MNGGITPLMKLPAAPLGGISAPLRQGAGYSGEGE